MRLNTCCDSPADGGIRPRGLGFVALGLVIGALTVGPILGAQDEEERPLGERETRISASMRESTYKELAQAQEKADGSQFSDAIQILDKLRSEELNSYELSQVWNLYAYIYFSQERLPQAITAYETLLAQEDLPKALETGTIYSLAQLYYMTERWREAIEMLERWFSLGTDPGAQAYELLAQAYYQLEEYRQAIEPTRKAMELTRADGKPVKENSYVLLRVLYYELGEFEQVEAILKELIKRFPQERYWMQLASIYGELGNERKQLNTMELAYLQGFLDTESEVIMLISLLLQSDLPYRAGTILEKELDKGVVTPTLNHWRLLSQAWTLAKEDEKAIPALDRAAGLSSDGELFLVLAQAHMNLEQWESAADAARTGIRKGGLERPDEAQILLGQALFSMEAFDEARTAFAAAQGDRRSRRLAAQWLSYIDSEAERRAQLRAALD